MNVIGFSGSPRKDGNTDRLVKHVLAGAAGAGAETAFVRIADASIHGCVACGYCRPTGVCALNDDMAPLLERVRAADVVVLGTPVYMGQMSGQTKIFVDRLLPVLKVDYSTRLERRPALFCVYTQGADDPASFRTYMRETGQFLAFLGFTDRGHLVATGTRERADVEKQTDLVARARAAGAALLKPAPAQ